MKQNRTFRADYCILSSVSNLPFSRELSARYGQQLFNIAEMTLKAFSPAVIADL